MITSILDSHNIFHYCYEFLIRHLILLNPLLIFSFFFLDSSTIRDKIIPHAVSWFTGEAIQGDEFGELEDDDDEDIDEDEDDEDDEDEEDDEDDDDDEDEDEGKTKKKVQYLKNLYPFIYLPKFLLLSL